MFHVPCSMKTTLLSSRLLFLKRPAANGLPNQQQPLPEFPRRLRQSRRSRSLRPPDAHAHGNPLHHNVRRLKLNEYILTTLQLFVDRIACPQHPTIWFYSFFLLLIGYSVVQLLGSSTRYPR